MKPILAVLVLTVLVSVEIGAQDIRSKVGTTSETLPTNIIDPDKGPYGAQWGCSEDEFIKQFGYPTGYIRLNNSETVMLYGKEQAFLFTAAKLSGVRITSFVLDRKLAQTIVARTPFDAVEWQLSNGVRKDMNLAEVKRILGDSLKSLGSQTYYFNSGKTRLELDFSHFLREGENDEAYRIYGIYLRQRTSLAVQQAQAAARPSAALIPAVSRPCTAEIATWWQTVRTAATEIVETKRRKSQAISFWYQTHPPGSRVGSGPNTGLPKKELDKLEADIATAVEKYRQVLAEGRTKAYQAPIEDAAQPVVFHMGRPGYTEQARKNKISGTVSMRAEFRSDGTIGEVQVISGLKDGLDEKAIQAARETLFLPSVKDGRFVTIWIPLQVEFSTVVF